MVRLCLLGDVRVELDEGQVELASVSRKARLLLAMLALERRVHGRSELAGRLWPDVREDSARVSLRTALSQLRSALGPAAPLVLRSERDGGVSLAAELVTDVEEIDRLLATGNPEAAFERCSSQLLLPGVDDDWVLERRDDLRDRIADGLGVAAAEAEEAGELDRAVELTRRMSALDPLAETPHRELIRRLAATGDRGAALAIYERFRDRLAEELRVAPSAATRAVVEELRADEPPEQPPEPPRFSTRRARATAARVPVVPTPTLGREEDLERLGDLLADPATRLLTVVGPGGVGKTRMALELGRLIADARPDGAAFVSLASVAEADHVALAISQTLDVLAVPEVPIEETLARHFAGRDLLLILDNFEHVLGAATVVADLLAAAPGLAVLATSREPLRLRAERIFELTPLPLPAPADGREQRQLQESPAVALFVQTARAQDPSFAPTSDELAEIAVLCRRLDGLPLAIELAAGRMGLLSVRELAARLSEGIEALGPGPRDAPQRQQTLHATLSWSYELLDADEQAVFARLAVFAGGADLTTAQTVTEASLEVLQGLTAKHLVLHTRGGDGASRVGMLEVIREFARAQLRARSDADLIALRHAESFLELCENAAMELRRSGSEGAAARLDPEIDNIRAALAYAVGRPAPELALRLAVAFDEYLEMRNPPEGEDWVRTALEVADAGVPASVRAAALHRRAIHLNAHAAWESAEAAARENFALCEELDDARGRSLSLIDLAWVRLGQQRPEADEVARDAVWWGRRGGDDVVLAIALAAHVMAADTLDEARVAAEEAATLFAGAGNFWQLTVVWINLAYLALGRGDYAVADRALRLARDAAARCGQAGDLRLALIDGNQGLLDLFRGDYSAAAGAFCAQLQRVQQYGFERQFHEGLSGVAAAVSAGGGDATTVARLCGAADVLTAERGDPMVLLRVDALVQRARARLGEAAWARAYAEGAALSAENAVDLAFFAARRVRLSGVAAAAGD